jgi:hypothetical protein
MQHITCRRIGERPFGFAENYDEALRLRRCFRKNTSTPAAIMNIAVSKIWVIAFSFHEEVPHRHLMNLFHHWEQILEDLQQTRARCHDHH